MVKQITKIKMLTVNKVPIIFFGGKLFEKNYYLILN